MLFISLFFTTLTEAGIYSFALGHFLEKFINAQIEAFQESLQSLTIDLAFVILAIV